MNSEISCVVIPTLDRDTDVIHMNYISHELY